MGHNKRGYKFYVVDVQKICIDSGWEERLDALQRATDLGKEPGMSPGAVKVMTKPRIGFGANEVVLDPNKDESWTPKRMNPRKIRRGPSADVVFVAVSKRDGSSYAVHQRSADRFDVVHSMSGKTIERHDDLSLREVEEFFDNIVARDGADALATQRGPGMIQNPSGQRANPGAFDDLRATIKAHQSAQCTCKLGNGPQAVDRLAIERCAKHKGWKLVNGVWTAPRRNPPYAVRLEEDWSLLPERFDTYEEAVDHGRKKFPPQPEWDAIDLHENPGELLVVNPSGEADSAKAEKVYEMWHKKEPHNVSTLRAGVLDSDVMVAVGKAHNIVYRSGKWEKGRKTNDYVHHFDSKPKVWMLASVLGDDAMGAEKTVGELLAKARNREGRFAVADLATPLSFGLDDGTSDGMDIAISAGSRVYGAVDQRTVIIYDPKWKLIIIKGGEMYFDERGIVK